jgi:hypothetical protein
MKNPEFKIASPAVGASSSVNPVCCFESPVVEQCRWSCGNPLVFGLEAPVSLEHQPLERIRTIAIPVRLKLAYEVCAFLKIGQVSEITSSQVNRHPDVASTS